MKKCIKAIRKTGFGIAVIILFITLAAIRANAQTIITENLDAGRGDWWSS